MLQKSFLILLSLFLFCSACNRDRTIPIKTTTIPIKAAIIYKVGGGAQPVARTKFYLLNKDLKQIEKDVGLSVVTDPDSARILRQVSPESNFLAGIDEEKIKGNIVMTTTTDFEGEASFENVPPGIYFIIGYTETRNSDSLYDSYRTWNVRIDTAQFDGKPILIDQHNALNNRQ